MHDKIFGAFLKSQLEEATELERSSDLVAIQAVAPQAFALDLRCKGLVNRANSGIKTAELFHVGIWFPMDYLRRANPMEVVTWLGPSEVFHPNIKAPFICIGHLTPGTPLVDIIFRAFRIVAYQSLAMHDALNTDASAWARLNQHRFPVDSRPLKRKTRDLDFEVLDEGESR